ncbi:hypothetical protein F5884DRAFT_290075 [Xylogone sp. PMI_703]|nr:hypothetical protein F5884DRAFT_290075 [Xylogone sp. PMI_703]
MANSYPSGSPGIPEASMPTGAPNFMQRRSSYASVVSGTAAATSQPYQQPLRSGAFSHLLNYQSDQMYDPTYSSRYDMRGYDMDGGVNGRTGSWNRPGQLPSFSSAFGNITNGHGLQYGYAPLGTPHGDSFFIPSYLKGSAYVRKLEEAHKAKLAAQKDGPSAHSSQPGSLSTSTSSVNLQAKIAPSHRGMTYDLIEKAPPADEEALAPLPSKWNTHDKHASLEVVADGLEVKFGSAKSATDRDHEACAIRADHPMPLQCGIYYFEVTVLSRKREESSIGIGFSSKNVPLSRIPGWEPDSWAYHGDDGQSFCCQSAGKHYGPPFSAGDVIGCGVNFRTGSAFFTKNGDHLGTAFREIRGKLFPSIGMKKSGEHIRVNFGQTPFVFDIDGMMLREKRQTRQNIEKTSTAKLAPPLNETELIQALVLQFLAHDGYVETARAFAEEVHAETKALSLDPDAVVPGFDVKEDEDAIHRQRIRTAILDGDIDKALKYTTAYYPNVLRDNEHVYFRLKCRKFIEMIRQGAEMHNATMNTNKKSASHNGGWYDDIINHEMELDDHQEQSNNTWDKMNTEGTESDQVEYHNLLEDTLQYGQLLQAEFKDDPRREVKKALEDAFALMAYQDPLNAKGVAHLLDPSGRVAVAEELNSAILQSLGKSSTAALEQLYQQTTVLLDDLRDSGGPGAFVNIDDYVRPSSSFNDL